MQWWKRYKLEMFLALIILVTLVGLVVVSSFNKPPTQPEMTMGELLGQGSNRSAISTNTGGAPLTDSQIQIYQDELRTRTNDAELYADLGLAYLQKVREVADPSYYTKAEQVFNQALKIDPNNASAMSGMGSLALSRHQFSEGLVWGQKAQKLDPGQAYNYGVINDAEIELGQYDQAATTLQQMVDIRPDLSSYSRISYQRELHGQYQGAIDAMQQAIIAGGPADENSAWVIYQQGTLYFNENQLDQAEAYYQQALQALPNYVYAQSGLAKIAAARGDLKGAIATYVDLCQRMPLAEFIIELGDLYTANNQPDKAKQQYDLVHAINKLYSDNGVDTDMEMALFDADHANDLPAALAKAQHEMQIRPSIKAADVLAWTLYQSGDYQAAQTAMDQATRLGWQDSLMFFHAGMIADKLGQKAKAQSWFSQALAHNPNFSLLYVPVAQKMLAELGGPTASK